MTQELVGWTRGTGQSLERTIPTGLGTPGADPAAASRSGRAHAFGTTGGIAPGLYERSGRIDSSSLPADFGDSESYTKTVPATLIGADHNTDIGIAPFDGQVVSVAYTPATTITGADTNSRTVQLVKGSTVLAELDLTAGNDAVGGSPTTVPIVAAAVAEGDDLVWQSIHVGTGLVDPGGTVTVNLAS